MRSRILLLSVAGFSASCSVPGEVAPPGRRIDVGVEWHQGSAELVVRPATALRFDESLAGLTCLAEGEAATAAEAAPAVSAGMPTGDLGAPAALAFEGWSSSGSTVAFAVDPAGRRLAVVSVSGDGAEASWSLTVHALEWKGDRLLAAAPLAQYATKSPIADPGFSSDGAILIWAENQAASEGPGVVRIARADLRASARGAEASAVRSLQPEDLQEGRDRRWGQSGALVAAVHPSVGSLDRVAFVAWEGAADQADGHWEGRVWNPQDWCGERSDGQIVVGRALADSSPLAIAQSRDLRKSCWIVRSGGAEAKAYLVDATSPGNPVTVVPGSSEPAGVPVWYRGPRLAEDPQLVAFAVRPSDQYGNRDIQWIEQSPQRLTSYRIGSMDDEFCPAFVPVKSERRGSRPALMFLSCRGHDGDADAAPIYRIYYLTFRIPG